MTTIRQVVCNREPYFVRESATALDAARYMAERNIGAVCVLDGDDTLRGIFSERDLLKRVVCEGRDPARTPIVEVMKKMPLSVITCEETPHEALEQMEQVGSRHLPVVDGERFIGMLSMRDIMRVEISDQGAELRLLHDYIQH